MRRKRGSCTSRGTLTLAVDLMEPCPDFREFVTVHELLHLRYSTHGKLFEATLFAYVPGDGYSTSPSAHRSDGTLSMTRMDETAWVTNCLNRS